MTGLSSRAFAFSVKCELLTSLSWGSANRTVRSRLSQLPSTKLSWRSAAFLLTCSRGHVTRIALAKCSLLATLMPLPMDGAATLFLPSFPAHLHFLSSERASEPGFLRLPPGLLTPLLQLWNRFLSTHTWALAATDSPKDSLLCSLIFILLGMGPRTSCALSNCFASKSHSRSPPARFGTMWLLTLYDCSASFSEKPSVLASQASPYLLSSFHSTFSD